MSKLSYRSLKRSETFLKQHYHKKTVPNITSQETNNGSKKEAMIHYTMLLLVFCHASIYLCIHREINIRFYY